MKKSKHQPKNQQKQERKDKQQEQTNQEQKERKPFWKFFSWRLKKPSSTTEGELWM